MISKQTKNDMNATAPGISISPTRRLGFSINGLRQAAQRWKEVNENTRVHVRTTPEPIRNAGHQEQVG